MNDNASQHVTRATFYRNGDANFKGKLMVVNPRYYRNFESFLDTVTWSTRSTNAVTRICTPQGRNFVRNVDGLQNGGNYVVLGRERFKKLNYGEEKVKNTTTRLPPITRSQMPSSGRYRKVYEGEKQALKRIYVYRNGDNKSPPRMILLKKRYLADMEIVLQTLQDSRMSFDFAISKLFTLSGKQVHSCEEIVHDGRYVAMERGSRFKPINYGGITNPRTIVNVSRFTKLPPIASRVNPEKITTSPRKTRAQTVTNNLAPSNQSKRTDKKRTEKRQQKRNKQPMPAQDSIVSPFEDQNLTHESYSHVSLSVTPPPLDESPDFTLSETIAKDGAQLVDNAKKETSSERPSTHDNEQDIGLQLYNASGMQKEWGDMVVDGKNAVTDKPIDDVPAEEINDEVITESDEQSPENSMSNSEIARENDEHKNINEKEEEIRATASRLVEKILKEEESQQSITMTTNEPINDQAQESHGDSYNNEKNDEVKSLEQSIASSQEDINSEDEVESSQEDENIVEMNDKDEREEIEEEVSETSLHDDKEDSVEEELATKENKTNKKAEKKRQDPLENKKKDKKQNERERRREKRVDNKA